MPLEIVKLSKRFQNNWVLRDITFAAAEGSVYGICGATASGKSTLLSVIAGASTASGGSVLLDSKDLSAVKAKNRGFTLVSNRETVGVFTLIKGGSNRNSSGEAQIESFEKSLLSRAKVLLLDDPFDQMDNAIRQACFEKVRGFVRRHNAICVFASSSFAQITELADTTAILSASEISQTGSAQELFELPETRQAATITGENNLFEARRISSSDADLPEFQTIDGGHRIFVHRKEKSRLGPINKNMTLAIRPEQISMSMGASFPEDNLLRAVVTDIKFCGPTSLIGFDADGLRLEMRVFKVVGLNIGDECMLGLPPHRILILKD